MKKQKQGTLKVLKATTPNEIIKAAEHYFARKEDFTLAKNNLEKSKETILSEMRREKITMAKVYDRYGTPRRIIICGKESLKIEKALDE